MGIFETIAFAEGTAAAGAAAGTGAAGAVNPVMGTIVSLLPMVAIIAVMYFLMIRPQRKKEKETRDKVNAMKVGDKVTTIGGVIGKVHKIKDDFVVIETGNVGTPTEVSYIKMLRSSISDVQSK